MNKNTDNRRLKKIITTSEITFCDINFLCINFYLWDNIGYANKKQV